MGLKKFGTPDHQDGKILPEPGDDKKTAQQSGWTDDDRRALAAENARADTPSDE